jgi:hypothetical protein
MPDIRNYSVFSLPIQSAPQFPPPPPEPPTDGHTWGNGLRDLSQKGLDKGWEALKKKTIWKGSDSDKNNSSNSLWNTGNEKMPDNLSHLGDYGKGNTIVEGEWHLFRVGEVDYKDQGDWGSFYAKGATDFMKVQGRVYGTADWDDWTAKAGIGVQGRIEIVGSHYEAGYTTPTFFNLGGHDLNLQTKVNADAYVGASGFAEAEVGIGKNTHVNLGAGGFDGASASLRGSENLGDLGGVNGGVAGWTGIGAKVDVDAGFKDGEFSFHFGAGLALGLGLEYDWGFSINFAEIGDSLYNVLSDSVGFVGDVGDWAEGAAEDVADFVGDAGEWAGNAAEDAADWVGGAAEDVGDTVGGVVEDVGDFFGF